MAKSKRKAAAERGDESATRAAGGCTWETATGMPWKRLCGKPVVKEGVFRHMFCAEHEQDAKDLGGRYLT